MAPKKQSSKYLEFLMIIVFEIIDKIYCKERNYTSNVEKDTLVSTFSPIFDLNKISHLKSSTGVEKTKIEVKQLKNFPSQLHIITGL